VPTHYRGMRNVENMMPLVEQSRVDVQLSKRKKNLDYKSLQKRNEWRKIGGRLWIFSPVTVEMKRKHALSSTQEN
jgi:hypothetical protein